MNEIVKQIIEIGNLINEKVLIKQYIDGICYNINDTAVVFTVEDFDYFANAIYYQVIKLEKLIYSEKFGYYLAVFNS